MLDEWLLRQIDSDNFAAIYTQVVKDNSLSMFSGVVADAVYKEIDNADGDCDMCLSILQAMLDKDWQWSNTRADIHRLLPLYCQLERLSVPGADRNQYYGSSACVFAAATMGNVVTVDGFQALLSGGLGSSVADGL